MFVEGDNAEGFILVESKCLPGYEKIDDIEIRSQALKDMEAQAINKLVTYTMDIQNNPLPVKPTAPKINAPQTGDRYSSLYILIIVSSSILMLFVLVSLHSKKKV